MIDRRDNTGIASDIEAFLLAAGFGTRLRPLTDYMPKPVMPLLNIPLIHLHCAILEEAGFAETVINVHHLPEALMNAVDRRTNAITCRFLREPDILGTGGALANVWRHGTKPHLLVMNGDIVCHPPLHRLIQEHVRKGALATLLLRHDPQADDYGRISVDETGRIVSMPTSGPPTGQTAGSGMFTGVHVLSRKISSRFPPKDVFCIVRDVYAPLIREKAPIYGLFTDTFWMDIGTPDRYFNVNMELLANHRLFPWPRHLTPRCPDSRRCLIDATASIDDTVILEKNVIVGPGCHLRGKMTLANTIVMPDTTIQGPLSCRNAIIHQRGRIDL